MFMRVLFMVLVIVCLVEIFGSIVCVKNDVVVILLV